MSIIPLLKELVTSYRVNDSDAQIVAADALKINRAGLYIYDKELTLSQNQKLHQRLSELSKGKPVAYILGYKNFWSLKLEVNEHTLIPRDETELIIETMLTLLHRSFSGDVLDLGTGSGAIALSLAHEFPKANIWATDMSQEALKVAEKNRKLNQIDNVSFKKSNWFEDMDEKKFDFITSNPPYIDPQDPHLKNLQYEPQSALIAEKSGLADLQTIISQASQFLRSKGWLLVEHGYNQKQAVQKLFEQNNFKHIDTISDLNGMPRMSLGQIIDIKNSINLTKN